jgi:cupredoxin-like protein
MGRLRPAVVLLALIAAACGGGANGPGGGDQSACEPKGPTLHLIARSTRFAADCLAAPANTALTINFDNQDGGVPHNVGIYDEDPRRDPNARELFRGGLVTGADMTTYEVGPLPAGTYHFRCDVYPDQMFGTLLVGG